MVIEAQAVCPGRGYSLINRRSVGEGSEQPKYPVMEGRWVSPWYHRGLPGQLAASSSPQHPPPLCDLTRALCSLEFITDITEGVPCTEEALPLPLSGWGTC